jgi:hypothetical protein
VLRLQNGYVITLKLPQLKGAHDVSISLAVMVCIWNWSKMSGRKTKVFMIKEKDTGISEEEEEYFMILFLLVRTLINKLSPGIQLHYIC